jgi:hypothetical protein
MQEYARSADSAKDFLEKLQQVEVTHLIVNFSLFNYWVRQYSIHEKQVLKDFFDEYVVIEFSKDGYGLLRIIT